MVKEVRDSFEEILNEDIKKVLQSCIMGPARRKITLFIPT
jgi:hypothetical protein